MVKQLIQAHSYWRMKGLTVDLVILNEDVSVYRQSLQDQITRLISSGIEAQMLDKPGGIFVRRLEQIPNDDRVLLQAAARIVLDDEKGTLGGTTGTSPDFGALGSAAADHPLPGARFARAAPAPRFDFSQRLGRLYPRRPRICHHPSARPDDAGAVGQCAGQSFFRNGRFPKAARLTPGWKTPMNSG